MISEEIYKIINTLTPKGGKCQAEIKKNPNFWILVAI
jgi:hypothetical protein